MAYTINYTQAESISDIITGADDETIYAALLDIALNYPAAFRSVLREAALAQKAAAYFNQSKGV